MALMASVSATPRCDLEKTTSAVLEGQGDVPTAPSVAGRERKWELAYRSDLELTDAEDQRLRTLLVACFYYNPIFWFRRYYLERPAHRWIARNTADEIVGHVAVHDKVVGSSQGDIRIGGLAEVCVTPSHRGLGILKGMLQTVHEWMAARDYPFSMLYGQPHIYTSSGYSAIANDVRASNSPLRWLVPRRGRPMIKALGALPWPKGRIDLRGPTF